MSALWYTTLLPLSPYTAGKWQPLAGRHRPRPHCDDDGIGLENRAVDLDAQCRGLPGVEDDVGHASQAQLCAPSIAACSIASVNRAGCTCAVDAWVPSLPCTCALLTEPGGPGHGTTAANIAPLRPPAHSRFEPAIAPAAAVEHGGQLRMQSEAAPGEPAERGAIAPIQRQEAARLPRGGAGDAGPLDHEHLDLPQAEEVGGAGADHPTAADHHAHEFDPAAVAKGCAIGRGWDQCCRDK